MAEHPSTQEAKEDLEFKANVRYFVHSNVE